MKIDEMPILRPRPIVTKDRGIFTALWRWLTALRTWRVDEDFEYDLPDGGKIVIPKGFGFDGASIPRLFWWFLSPIGLLLIPGLIHDFGYRFDVLVRRNEEGRLEEFGAGDGKKAWDRLFRKVALQVNGFGLIHYVAWSAVAIGGWWAWRTNRKRDQEPYWRKREDYGMVAE